MQDLISLIFSIAPTLIIIIAIHNLTKYSCNSRVLLISFIIGCYCLICLISFYTYIIDLSRFFDGRAYWAALIEEPLKFIFLLGILTIEQSKSKGLTILFSSMIALGFATIENIGYVFNYDVFDELNVLPTDIAIYRAVSAVPMHFCCGLIMGYFYERYQEDKYFILLLLSVVIPISLHGIYNFLTSYSFGFAIIILFIGFGFILNKTKLVDYMK